MPLIIDPDLVQEKVVNTIIIDSFMVDNNNSFIMLMYSEGNTDGETLTVLHKRAIQLTGQDFYDIVLSYPAQNKTYYENLKDILYATLMRKLGLTGMQI